MEFVTLSDSLVEVLSQPDPSQRRRAIDAWVASALTELHEAVPDALSKCVEKVMDVVADDRRQEMMKSKFDRGVYRLSMEFKFQRVGYKADLDPTPSRESSGSWDDGGSDYSDGSRSPNDDRSDSMNPNNPASQAADDNRSNQMNPNNPAYDSSRGGARGR